MGIQSRFTRARATAGALALATGMIAAGGAVAAPAGAATAAGAPAGHGAAAGVVHPVAAAAQRATHGFWTRTRMTSATPAASRPRSTAGAVAAAASAGAAGHPVIKPVHFSGVPTVGTLFSTTGAKTHFCSASVVNSFSGDMIVTAAHCVYGSSYATNIEYVPEYHRGDMPYGAWPVQTITVARQWIKSHNQNYDFAFLTVTPPSGTSTPIQRVTGGLWLGINQGFDHSIEVIGYNNVDNEPIKCATTSFKHSKNQMKFFCRDFQDGTSGGPWILGFNATTGAGTVFGVVGGFDEGGNFTWSSYSAYFGWPTLELFRQAQGVTSTT